MNYMYRCGDKQGIKIFYPRIPDKQHEKNVLTKKIIYVTDDVSFAAGFCFNWSDNDGYKFGKYNNDPWLLQIPNKYMYKLNNKCSMYIINDNSAKRLKTKTPEYYYGKSVNVFKEILFNSCIECLNFYNVNVEIL